MIRKKLFFALLCSLLINTQPAVAAQSLDRIIATVNDAVITQSDLNQAISAVKKQIADNHLQTPPADVLHKQVLDQIINKKLQTQIAAQMGIHIGDEDVNKTIATIAKENHVTTDQVYQKVTEQGLSKAEYRKEIHDELEMQQAQQMEVGSKIVITAQEIDAFMHSKAFQAFNTKEYHLEDILIELPEAPSPEQIAATKKRAQALLTTIHKGTSFTEVAQADSNSASALSGGDLGWRKLAEIPSAFSSQLTQAQANDIIGPIQTPNGFHIIRLAGVRSVGQQGSPIDQRKQVHQLIFQRKFEEGMQTWTTRLRSAATINLHPEV